MTSAFQKSTSARQESKVTMLADSRCELAKALDLVLDHPTICTIWEGRA